MPLLEAGALLVAAGFAVVFMFAGTGKLHDSAGLQRTLETLGASPRVASPLARVIPLLELILATGLVLFVGHPVGAALGLIAGAVLVVVGFMGVTADTPVPCSCFSVTSAATLGSRQVLLGGSLGLAMSVAAVAEVHVPLGASLAILLGMSVLAAVLQGFRVGAIALRLAAARSAISG
mgnify:CR=1 FL=1